MTKLAGDNTESLEREIDALKKKLAESEQQKADLLKVVSHDIKSPFNKIFALCNLLKLTSDNLDEEQEEYISTMEMVIKEGLSLVRNLLDIRAIDYKGIEMLHADIDIKEELAQSKKAFMKAAERKGITLNMRHLEDVTSWTDKQYLGRIFDQLLSNAIKYGPKESNVDIDLHKSETTYKVSIMDSGVGLTEEEIPDLYKRFTPLLAQPTGGENSIGLGLFIAQTLAKKMGGEVSFEPLNTGSKFMVTMPIKESQKEES